jgi:hypothetical protein
MDEMRDIIPSLIENTTMQLRVVNDTPRSYWITPVDGYVLHDTSYDYHEADENGNPTGVVVLGYRTSTATCGANYDFTANPREFYAVPADSVPADQIFGGGGDHEVM